MKVSIQYIGHSTFIINIDKKENKISIITDPWFEKSSLFLRRIHPPALNLEDIRECDFMLVSHSHRDHFDSIALNYARKNWNPSIVGPPSVIWKAKKCGLSDTIVVCPGASLDMGDFTVKVVRALHPVWGGKDAVGYIIVLDDCSIYFAGDTLYSDEVIKDVNNFRIHTALLPIGSAKVFFKKVVMDTRDAIRFAIEIHPNIVIPMHYNVLRGTEANPEEMREPLAEKGIELRVLNLGETTIVEGIS